MHGLTWAEAPGPSTIRGLSRAAEKKNIYNNNIFDLILTHDRRRPKIMGSFVLGLQRTATGGGGVDLGRADQCQVCSPPSGHCNPRKEEEEEEEEEEDSGGPYFRARSL